MMNDLKLGLKLMKHGLQLKSSILSLFAFAIIGIAFELGESKFAIYKGLGGVFVIAGSIMIYQLVQSLSCAGLIQGSSYKRKIQTSISALATLPCALILNTVVVFINIWEIHNGAITSDEAVVNTLFSSIGTVIMLVYIAAAMKMFWVATLAFAFLFSGIGFFTGLLSAKGILLGINISFGVAVLISYFAVFLGCALMYLVSSALYKKEFAKESFESTLKRVK